MAHFLIALALAAGPSPIQSADRLEPIGWSADQRTVALRVFFGGTFGELPACLGYIDAAGKPFETGLAIVVLRDNAVVHSFVIQEPPDKNCTAPASAKKALEAAKKQLEALGIDRSAAGTVLTVTVEKGTETNTRKDEAEVTTWKETWRARNGDQTPLELVAAMKDTFEDEMLHTVTATVSWKLRSKDVERTGALKLGPVTWSLNMAGGFNWQLRAFASPNAEAVVAFIAENHFNMRGSSAVTMLLPLAAKK